MEAVDINNQQDSGTPLALVKGEALTQLPKDLYIPPDALQVFLQAFEGPLDLLLYLIKKQNLDILDIPICTITEQYMEYIGLMQEMRLELAGDYLLMAAMLAEIKSRFLLPRPKADNEAEDEDPRAELVRRLQAYEILKQAAEGLDEMPRLGRDHFNLISAMPEINRQKPLPDVDFTDLIRAFHEVMQRAKLNTSHQVGREALSIRERMSQILEKLADGKQYTFIQLLLVEQGRLGVVVSFIATLELWRHHAIELTQVEVYSPIYVKAVNPLTREHE